jgi:hypothetical protein
MKKIVDAGRTTPYKAHHIVVKLARFIGTWPQIRCGIDLSRSAVAASSSLRCHPPAVVLFEGAFWLSLWPSLFAASAALLRLHSSHAVRFKSRLHRDRWMRWPANVRIDQLAREKSTEFR